MEQLSIQTTTIFPLNRLNVATASIVAGAFVIMYGILTGASWHASVLVLLTILDSYDCKGKG